MNACAGWSESAHFAHVRRHGFVWRGPFNVICDLQVCFNGVNEANGKSVEKALQEVYGADSVMFLKCDVSKEEEFKGYVNYLLD